MFIFMKYKDDGDRAANRDQTPTQTLPFPSIIMIITMIMMIKMTMVIMMSLLTKVIIIIMMTPFQCLAQTGGLK